MRRSAQPFGDIGLLHQERYYCPAERKCILNVCRTRQPLSLVPEAASLVARPTLDAASLIGRSAIFASVLRSGPRSHLGRKTKRHTPCFEPSNSNLLLASDVLLIAAPEATELSESPHAWRSVHRIHGNG
jgi:hypothetical protein